jgi:hypothetical protein
MSKQDKNKPDKVTKKEITNAMRSFGVPHVFPSQLLNQIRENSKDGAFVLFTVNEAGVPIVNANFERDLDAVGLPLHVGRWASEIMQMHNSVFHSNMFPQNDEGNEEE